MVKELIKVFRWIGKDDRGVEIEIIAVATPQYLLGDSCYALPI